MRLQPLPAPPRLVAGVDAAYSKTDRQIYGAAVVMSLPELVVVETATACGTVAFPYLPGLFSFREAPILQAALRQLRQQPDVILVDGHGIAHPRGLGLASYLGLLLDTPTIGCAKSRLWGEYEELTSGERKFLPPYLGGQKLRLGAAVAAGSPAVVHFPRSLNNRWTNP